VVAVLLLLHAVLKAVHV
jgi:ribonuclease P protein component